MGRRKLRVNKQPETDNQKQVRESDCIRASAELKENQMEVDRH